VAASTDAGTSWQIQAHLDENGATKALQNPHVTTDSSGAAYALYQGANGHAYLARGDHGDWSQPLDVTAPGITATFFSQVVAAGPGQVAFLYHGTRNDTSQWLFPEPDWADPHTVWHTFLTITDDAASQDPTFVTYQVTPDDDPVMVGCASLGLQGPCYFEGCPEAVRPGGNCEKRTLNDFLGMDSRAGLVYGFIEDACDRCKDQASSNQQAGFLLKASGVPHWNAG
jgi:hypothetical protein